MKKCAPLFFALLFSGLFLAPSAGAFAKTQLFDIRSGQHPGFSRLVFDSKGARPSRIDPAIEGGITFRYRHLELLCDLAKLTQSLPNAVATLNYTEKPDATEVSIAFRQAQTRVKTFFLPPESPQKNGYRLVVDIYPRKMQPDKRKGQATGHNPPNTRPGLKNDPLETISESLQNTESAPVTILTQSVEPAVGIRSDTAVVLSASDPPGPSVSETTAEQPTFDGLSGEVGLVFQSLNGDDDSSKFSEYRDFSEPLSGELIIKYENKERYFIEFIATDIAEDDQYLNLNSSWYGKLDLDFSYDKIPHRYAFDAKTLYTGVGSNNLALDDDLQADLQSTPISDRADRLQVFFNNAFSGDPEMSRDKIKMGIDALVLDPFNFRVEFKREDRDGTKPFGGTFGLENMVELFEPIDDETSEVRLIAEYNRKPFFINASYSLAWYKNHVDTLAWDNPFRLDDTVGGPSRGQIDLAPDNTYQNAALSAALTDLPFKTRIAASAAWGWMSQDDDLVPYTSNTALVSGAFDNAPFDTFDPANLPQKSADAKVNTSLYHVRLTSRPQEIMYVSGKFRYFEYDNDTKQIQFPGQVGSDDFWNDQPLANLPSSYNKTTAGSDLGFDLFRHTRLGLGYTFEQTRRSNREVSRQKDHVFGPSLDTKPWSWLEIRTSYERTERDINNYDFTAPLKGGGELADTFPFLRKYTEADMSRDRFKLSATLYPAEPLSVGGSFIYGKDDFKDSPFGLLDDRHYIISFDADYAVTERANLHAFYNYEKYRNRQKARQWDLGGPGDPGIDDTFESFSNWYAKSEDVIRSLGGAVTVTVIPDRLDLEISYSYSDADGEIDFFSPLGPDDVDANNFVPSEFVTVDQTILHILSAQLKYRLRKGFFMTLGYMYEKFDYDDFNTEGFSNIPVDSDGSYNGALLADTLPQDYSVNLVYTKFSYRF